MFQALIQGHSEFTKLANLIGIPAITVPLGFDHNQMPIGFHFMATWWAESVLMELAATVEARYTYHKPTIYLKKKFI